MSYAVHFRPVSMSKTKYLEVHRRLETAGHGTPAGRLVHVGFGPEEELQVLDVWDTMDNFQAFGQVLMPVLAEMGIDPGEPAIQPVHRLS